VNEIQLKRFAHQKRYEKVGRNLGALIDRFIEGYYIDRSHEYHWDGDVDKKVREVDMRRVAMRSTLDKDPWVALIALIDAAEELSNDPKIAARLEETEALEKKVKASGVKTWTVPG
jgi:hypothetical protein